MLSPIDRLPPELLFIIFVYCARLHHETTELKDGVPPWVNLSYVCRYWRDVTFNCPILWSDIYVASQRWTKELLFRSKQAPLRVHLKCTSDGSRQLPALKPFLDHIERVQELKLEIPSCDYDAVFPLFSSPAPLLRSLVVDLENDVPSRKPNSCSLFNGVTPALRRLELSRCPVSQPMTIPGSLTTLILRNSIYRTLSELTTALRPMRNLVHLELDRALDISYSTDPVGGVRLPVLSRLAINEHLSMVIALLDCLIVPSPPEVRIETNPDGIQSSQEKWVTLCSLLQTRIFVAGDNPAHCIRTFVVELDDDLKANLIFAESENNISWCSGPLKWGCNIPLQITIHNDMDVFSIRHIIGACKKGLLVGLQSSRVVLSFDDNWRCTHYLEDTIGFVPKLRSIQMTGTGSLLGCLASFLALAPHHGLDFYRDQDPESASGAPFGPSFAPDLEELVVGPSRFDHDEDKFLFLFDPPSHPGGTVSDLVSALSIRKEAGYTLKRLTPLECRNVFKEEVAKLKNLVAEVVWDEIEVDAPPVEQPDWPWMPVGSRVYHWDEESEDSTDQEQGE